MSALAADPLPDRDAGALSLATQASRSEDPGPRIPLLADPGTWFLILNGLLLAAFVLWLPLQVPGEAQTTLLGDLAFLFFGVSMVTMTGRITRVQGIPPRVRRGWRLISLGCLSYLVGGVIWFYYEVVLGIAPFPSLADLGYLGFYPPILAGIGYLLRPIEGRAERLLFWLDLSVVAIGAGALVWYFLLWPIAQGEHDSLLALLLAQAYPLSDTVLLVGVAALMLKHRQDRSIAPLAWLVAGLIAFFIADLRYAYDNAMGNYTSGGMTDLFYHLFAVLVMVGAWLKYRSPLALNLDRTSRYAEEVLEFLPYLSVAAVYGLLLPVAFGWPSPLAEGAGPEGLRGLLLAALVIALVVMIRQSVAMREIARLQAAQAAREAEALQAAKVAQRARTDTEERLRRLTDVAPDAILMMDAQGLITFWNPAATTILGYAAEEALGRNLHQLLAPERFLDAHLAGFALFQHTGEGQVVDRTIEVFARRKDGREIAIELSLASVAFADGWNAVGLIRDITQRKQAEQALVVAKQQAEAANRAKSEFLANMSHEIRTPMTGIIGMAQLALRTGLDARQRDYVQKIETSARSLLGILNDILDLSKIEAGKMEIERIPFDLHPLVDRVLNLVEIAAQGKGLDLRADYGPGLDSHFEGDPLRLTQILTNLLSNAIKFTPAGGSVLLVIRQPLSGRLRLEVRDTGIGMSEEARAKIFTPFHQGDSSTTRKYGGTGLGLIITKQLVELMGGTIEVASAPGHGSSFSIEIPAPPCPAQDQAPAPIPSQAQAQAQALALAQDQAPGLTTASGAASLPGASAILGGVKGSRLLLVEDNAINREIVLGLLEGSGLDILIARDGREAVEQYRQRRPDLILMDVQMPEMDGFEASRQIRALDAQVPIVALTANAFQEDVARSRAAGMNEHLSKPIETEQLFTVIKKYLDDAPAGPVLDTAAALTLLGGKMNLYLKILRDFSQTYEGLQLDLEDPKDRRVLHSLKGLSANIGARRLHELIVRLEASPDAYLLSALYEELAAVRAAIDHYVEAGPAVTS